MRFRAFPAVLAVLALTAVATAGCPGGDDPAYRFARLEMGEIQARVSATGTVQPVTLVQVGSQVSGTIDQVLVDYNGEVQAGQSLARIDPAPFDAQVRQAEANLARARADAMVARLDAERAERLIRDSLISRSDYDLARSKTQVAEAAVQQAEAALAVAGTNLAYTTIRSPVTGLVVARKVNRGQTVAASFQTPVLFTIAEDLTRMQVDTNVSEADIGVIREGQMAIFTVDAFPDTPFEASVREVRFDPVEVQNVITYDAVLEVANPDLKLRPGMTANVSFIVAEGGRVLRAPNAALRFVPPAEAAKEEEDAGDRARGGGGRASAAPVAGPRAGRSLGKLWVSEPDGGVRAAEVRIGISDERWTEIVSGEVKEGDPVAIGIAPAGRDEGVHNPFLPRRRR